MATRWRRRSGGLVTSDLDIGVGIFQLGVFENLILFLFLM